MATKNTKDTKTGLVVRIIVRYLFGLCQEDFLGIFCLAQCRLLGFPVGEFLSENNDSWLPTFFLPHGSLQQVVLRRSK